MSERLHCDPEWPRFAGADWAATIMQVDVRDRLHQKQGRSIARWTLTDDNGKTLTVYLKRFHRLPRWLGMFARCWPWRAWAPGLQEWEHLEWARAQGVPVPRVWAAGEFRGPGSRLQGFLAVEELTDMLPLHQAIPLAEQRLSAADFARFKRGLTLEMARLTRLLHGRHVFHKDLYLCHFYIPEAFTREVPADWHNRVFVIDLHRLAAHPLTRWVWKVKDLAQLLYSSDVNGVTARDRVRFWRQYLSGRPDWFARVLARFIRLKGLRYTRHNDKRKGR